jgi:UPF0716 family protein affecting phage T7 exclusion
MGIFFVAIDSAAFFVAVVVLLIPTFVVVVVAVVVFVLVVAVALATIVNWPSFVLSKALVCPIVTHFSPSIDTSSMPALRSVPTNKLPGLMDLIKISPVVPT